MYTVIWINFLTHEEHFVRLSSLEGVKMLLEAEGINSDSSVIIFPPEADNLTISVHELG